MNYATRVALLVICAAPAAASLNRIAVLAERPLREAGLADAVESAIAGVTGVRLIERDRIDSVIREVELESVLGADAAGKRLELSHMLSADALLVLAHRDDAGSAGVRLLLIDSATGARIADEPVPAPIDAGQLSSLGRSVVEGAKQRFPDGVKALVAVSPLQSKCLGYQFDSLQDGFANVIRAALLGSGDVAVLESDEYRAIQRERAIAESARRPAQTGQAIIEGEFRFESAGDKPLRLTVAISSGAASRKFEREFPGVAAAADFLRGEFTEAVRDVVGRKAAAMPADQLVARLAAQADRFTQFGQLSSARRIRETMLLIQPDNLEQSTQLIREYCQATPFSSRITWTPADAALWLRRISERLDGWRRALDMIAALIDQKRATQVDIITMLVAHEKAFSDFVTSANIGEEWNALQNPEARAAIESDLGHCVRARGLFIEHAIPRLRALHAGDEKKLAEKRPELPDGRQWAPGTSSGGPPESILRRLANYLARHPRQQANPRHASYEELLSHEVWALSGVLADIKFAYPNSRFELVITDPDSRGDISLGAIEQLIIALEQSPSIAAQIHAARYRLLLDCHRPGTALGSEQIARRIEEWTAAAQKARFEDTKRTAQRLKTLLLPDAVAQNKPVNAGNAPSGKTSNSGISRRDATVVGEFVVEEVPLRIEGESAPLHTPGQEVLEIPCGLVAAQTFDVLWSGQRLYWHSVPGILKPVFDLKQPNHPGIRSAVFDGENIWVATCCAGIMVFDSAAKRVAHLPAGDAMPAAHAGARLATIEKGKVFISAAFGPDKRAWCATLSRNADKIDVVMLHEATTVFANPDELRTAYNDPKAVFIPGGVYRDNSRKDTEAPAFFVQRTFANRRNNNVYEPAFLHVDTATREARLVDYEFTRFTVGGVFPQLLFIGADCFRIDRDQVHRHRPRVGTKAGDKDELLNAPDQNLTSAFFRYRDGYLILGRTWYRLDPATQTVAPFARWPSDTPAMNSANWIGESALLGLFIWDLHGRAYRITGTRSPEQAAERSSERAKSLDKSIAADPRDEKLRRDLVLEHYKSGNNPGARAAALAWCQDFPRSIRARYALCDVERQARFGFAQFDYDPSPHKKSFATLAEWRMHCDPNRGPGGGDVEKKALKLPFATDEAEWLIAEIAILECAERALRVRRFKQAVEICDIWQQAAEKRGTTADASHFFMRAAAHLGNSDFDAAKADAQQAVAAEKENRAWIKGAATILKLAEARDSKFNANSVGSQYEDEQGWHSR